MMKPEQTNIILSKHKHLLINGCYGSGKTIVACRRAKKFFEDLKPGETLHYITCDSRNKLGEGIEFIPKENVFSNKREMLPSAIVKEILKRDSNTEKLNLIFDEFDGECLDEAEAKKLNEDFQTNKRLKDSDVKIERTVHNTPKGQNMFEILETMKPPVQLSFNMRNTLEINNLVKATVNSLKDFSTRYLDPYPTNRDRPVEDKQKYVSKQLKHKKNEGKKKTREKEKINEEKTEKSKEEKDLVNLKTIDPNKAY